MCGGVSGQWVSVLFNHRGGFATKRRWIFLDMFQKVIGGVFWENIVAQWVYCGIFWDIIDNLGKLYWMNHDFLLMIIPKWSKLFSESLFLFCITFRWWNMLTEISSFEWEGCSHSNLHFYSKVFHCFPFNGDLTVHNGVLIELIWMAHLMVISWRLFLKRAHPSSFFSTGKQPGALQKPGAGKFENTNCRIIKLE